MARRLLALCLLWSACGCPSPPNPDAGLDAGDVDARDASSEVPACESAPPEANAGTCVTDADCEGDVCRASLVAGEVELACAPGVGGGPGADCASASECAHGLCASSGRCVAPCDPIADPDSAMRCARVWVRSDGGTVAATASVPRRALPEPVAADARFVDGSELLLDPASPFHVVLPRCAPPPRSVELTRGEVRLWGDRAGDPLPLFAEQGSPLALRVPAGDVPLPGEGDLRLVFDRTFLGEQVALRRAAGPGTLDLEVYFVGGGGLEPEGARGPPALVAMLDRAFAILGPEVRAGDVRQHRVGGTLRSRLSVLEAERGVLTELPELFGLASGADDPHIALFLVRDIDFRFAFSGGVPGPLGHPGVRNGGVVLALDALDGLDAGRVLAHELAHHLGLWHPVEFDGTVFEPLSDTPECEDADMDGTVRPEECVGQGADNLMFWSADTSGVELTSAQRAVLRGAPILR